MKKKIRFHINSLTGGGAEKVLVDLLNHLNPEDLDISLITTVGGIHERRLPEYVKYNKIVKCSRPRITNFLSKVVNKLPAPVYAWLFLQGDYDIEIAYLEGKSTRHIAAKKTKGKKYAFIHCDLSVSNLISSLYSSADNCLLEYKHFDRVCFVSEGCLQGFCKVYGPLQNSLVIHNFTDIDRIRRLSEEAPAKKYAATGVKMIAMGRLSREKAYDRLLYCIAILEKQYDFELWIGGEGPERENLERIIQKEKIRSVQLLGYCENPYPLMKQADVMVCSSLFEGYSTVVKEAITLGVPVITTECAGMKELLADGLGIITENSREGLQYGIQRYLENKELAERLKNNVRKKAGTISSEKAIEEYSQLFR